MIYDLNKKYCISSWWCESTDMDGREDGGLEPDSKAGTLKDKLEELLKNCDYACIKDNAQMLRDILDGKDVDTELHWKYSECGSPGNDDWWYSCDEIELIPVEEVIEQKKRDEEWRKQLKEKPASDVDNLPF